MAGGPNNYNHGKLYKPILEIHKSISEMQWINVVEICDITTLNKTRLSAIQKSCGSKCQIAMVKVTQGPVAWFRSGTCYMGCATHSKEKMTSWHVLCPTSQYFRDGDTYKIRVEVLSNPSYSPDIVYVSGAGGAASMMKWDNKWWIVYGIVGKTSHWNNDKWRDETKTIVLHNVLLEGWNSARADELVAASHKAFVEFVNNSQK